ncbi:MAG TPA: hypothetical protein VGM92_08525 [Candidatus Kapabacteria bacterium]
MTTLNDGSGTLGQWTVAGRGTSYVYLDSLQGIDTIRVLLNGQHLGGKQNVIVAVNVTQGGSPDTTWFNIEPNGDFSIGDRLEEDSDGFFVFDFNWNTFPVMSRTTIVLPGAVDTEINEEHVIRSITSSFVAVEPIQTPIGTYQTLHARFATVNDQIDSLEGFSFVDTTATDYWFAPQLGMYIREQAWTSEDNSLLTSISAKLIQYFPR